MSFAATNRIGRVFPLAAQCQDFAGAKMAGSCGCDGDFLLLWRGPYRNRSGLQLSTRRAVWVVANLLSVPLDGGFW